MATDGLKPSTAIPDIEALVGGRSRMRTALLGALGLAAIGAVAFLAYGRWFKQEVIAIAPPTEATVSRGSLPSTLTTSGSAAAGQVAALTFASSGRITSVSVKVGDQVVAGQELARVDDRDTRRRLEAAELNFAIAQTRLAQLLAPATDADARAAAQSVVSARAQLTAATNTLEKLTQAPAAVDVTAADVAVKQAEGNLDTVRRNVDSAFVALVAAQKTYCATPDHQGFPCPSTDVAASPADWDQIVLNPQSEIVAPSTVGTTLAGQRALALLQAHTAWLNAKTSAESTQQALTVALARRAALDQPADGTDVRQTMASVSSAQAGLDTALARESALRGGPTSFEVDLQREALRGSEIALQQAKDAVDDTVLRAPFDGTVAAVGASVGNQAGAGTAAVTISNPSAIRIDLTVSESDLPSLKVGQFGLALFDALAGRPFVVRVRGISTLPNVTQGVVSYPVQAEIVTGEALQQARSQLEALGALTGARGATPTGAGASGAGAGGASGTGGIQRPAGAQGGAGGQRAGGAGSGAAGAAEISIAPGMNASVTLLLRIEENVLLVPNQAIRRDGRQSYLMAKNASGGEERVDVVLGTANATHTVVTSGIEEGATVLIAAPAATATATAKAGTTTQGGPGGGFPGGGGVR